jgi:hypothetical protein
MRVETTSKIIRYRIPVRGDNIGDVAKLKIENDEIVLTFPNDKSKETATVNKLIYMDENN